MAKQRGKHHAFVMLTYELLDSAAFKALPPSAGKLLPYCLRKVKEPYGSPKSYSTDFNFSYTEAAAKGFASDTFSRSLHALIENGFINLIKKGGLRGFKKSNSLYRLSDRWRKYDTPDFVQQDYKNLQEWNEEGAEKKQRQHQKCALDSTRNRNDIAPVSGIGSIETIATAPEISAIA